MRNKIIIGRLLLGALSTKAQDTRLSAMEYKERALGYNHQVKRGSGERIAMQHAIRAAKTGFFSLADFSGSYQYRINKCDLNFGPGMSIEIGHNVYSLGATVSQPAHAGEQIYNSYKTAQVRGKITEQTKELAAGSIIYSTDLNYWTAAVRKGMYGVIRQYVDIVGGLANVLTIRLNDNQISKTDLLQVESRLKGMELNESSAYKECQIALQNLNLLMGVSPLGPIKMRDSTTTYLALPLQVGENVAPRDRPDYAIFELNIECQKGQINLSEVKYNPSLAIGSQGIWGTPMLSVGGSDQLRTPTVFASLRVPLFRWGIRFEGVNSQKTVSRSKEYALDNMRDKIAQEVANAQTGLTKYAKQIIVMEEACKIAEENLDSDAFGCSEGKLSISDMLSA